MVEKQVIVVNLRVRNYGIVGTKVILASRIKSPGVETAREQVSAGYKSIPATRIKSLGVETARGQVCVG